MVQKWQHARLVTCRLQEILAICNFIWTWSCSACRSYHEKNTFNCNLNIDLYFISNLKICPILYRPWVNISVSFKKKSGLNCLLLMHCLVPGSYFTRNTCGAQGFKQALKTSIYLCDETKRKQKRTGTCTCWTWEQIPYLSGQKEKGLAWLFQLYQCQCRYYREIKLLGLLIGSILLLTDPVKI